MAAMFIAAIEATIVATAVPTIVAKLGGFELFSWVFTAYLLTQALTVPIYGRLADTHGRKRVLLVAIGLFLAASVLCGLAWDMGSLIAFRAVQGIGAGGILPVTMTIVGDLYTPAERARIQGWLSAVWGVAAVLGPWLGAVLVAHWSWTLVFWINLPVGLVATVMLAALMRETVQKRSHAMDYPGTLLLSLGTLTLMVAMAQASALGPVRVAALVALAILFAVLFLIHEGRAAEPILPPSLWRNRIIAGANVANFAFGGVMMGVIAFLPPYVQGAMGRSAFAAAIALMAMSISWSVGATITARVMLATSYRTAAASGGSFMVLGSVLLAIMERTSGLPLLGLGAMIVGLGLGFVSNSFIVALQSTVDWTQRGVATSSILFTRMIGQSIAAAIFGGILNAGVSGLVKGDSEIANRLLEPTLRATLSPAENAALTNGVAAALHDVFVINAGLAVVVLLAALCLPAGLSPVRTAGSKA